MRNYTSANESNNIKLKANNDIILLERKKKVSIFIIMQCSVKSEETDKDILFFTKGKKIDKKYKSYLWRS